MKSATIIYIALFNLILGAALLVSGGVSDWPMFRHFENSFYKYALVVSGDLKPELMKKAQVDRVQLIHEEEDGKIHKFVRWELTPYDYAEDPRIVIIEVGDDPDHIFQENPPVPMDYAVIFYQLRELGVENISVTSSLAWPPPQDPFIQEALTYEIMDYDQAELGLVLSPSARQMELPKNLESIVLQPDQIEGGIGGLVGVGRVVELPAVQRDKKISMVPVRVETESPVWEAPDGPRLTLFIRWDNYVLPTLPLVSALDALGLGISDIKVEFGRELDLGGKRVLPIDKSGSISLSGKLLPTVSRVSATQLAIDEDARNENKLAAVLSGADMVILGEGKTPLAELGLDRPLNPWDWSQVLDATAAGVQTILGSLAPLETLWLTRMGNTGQIIVLLDILLLATWAMTFRVAKRNLFYLLLLLLLLSAGFCIAVWTRYWLPLAPGCCALVLAYLASLWFGKKDEVKEEDTEEIVMDKEDMSPVPPPNVKRKEHVPESGG